MNWNILTNNISTKEEYSEWEQLKKYFGGGNLTYLDLIGYHIDNNYPRYLLQYVIINRVMKPTGIKVPAQYATVVRRPENYPELYQFLNLIKSICTSHSTYTYIATMFVYQQNVFSDKTLADGTSWYINAPAWLKIILNRQHKLCKNAALKQTDPFYFLAEGDEIKKVTRTDIMNIDNLVQTILGITIKDYIYYYQKFAGMKKNGIVFEGSNLDVYTELKQRRKRNLLSPVSVLYYKDNKRAVYTHGICLKELENGIYLVDTPKGLLVVPFYLMDMPKIAVTYPPQKQLRLLYDLGYIPEQDWPKITTLSKLTKYKVKL